MSKFNTKEAHPASLEWKKKKTVSTALASQKAQFFIKNVLKARKKKDENHHEEYGLFPCAGAGQGACISNECFAGIHIFNTKVVRIGPGDSIPREREGSLKTDPLGSCRNFWLLALLICRTNACVQ